MAEIVKHAEYSVVEPSVTSLTVTEFLDLAVSCRRLVRMDELHDGASVLCDTDSGKRFSLDEHLGIAASVFDAVESGAPNESPRLPMLPQDPAIDQ